MRKLLAALLLLLVPSQVLAVCSDTPNRGLAQCPVGESSPNWVNELNNNWSLLDYTCTTPLSCAGTTFTIGVIPEAKGGFGTDASAVAKGSVPAFTANGDVSFVAPNTTTTKKFLSETGNGTIGAMPTWETLVAGDIPSPIIDAVGDISSTLCANNKVLLSNNPSAWSCADYTVGDSVKVNGTDVINANFNATTPSSPSGGTNVSWQTSGSNPASVSAYCPYASSSAAGCIKNASQDIPGTKTFVAGIVIGDGSSNDKIEFAEEGSDPTCASGNYSVWANSSDIAIKKCVDGTISALVGAADLRQTFAGSTASSAAGATMIATMYKPTKALTLTRISGVVLAAGTCSSCGVTDHTFRVTDGMTNSDCTNASAISCTTTAGTKFSCTPSNTSRAVDEELLLETVAGGGTCTTQPVLGIVAEYRN